MDTKHCLLEMEFGACRSFENMAVFPLRFSGNGGPEYITLGEALERGVLVVGEVSAGGSVPELMVENRGDVAVLILDGEELAGAKQNRVLNTTILVGPKSTTKIPVSCTEHGRWSYVSEVFRESGNVMGPRLRQVNMQRVHSSLRSGARFQGDQGAVWDGIARMHEDAHVDSMTGAMRDVFEAKRMDLDDYLKSFGLEGGQKGALVFIGGKAAGLDFVSREAAYGLLHAKLVKSYAMEAMLEAERAKARQGERLKDPDEELRGAAIGPEKEGPRKESRGKGGKAGKRGGKDGQAGQSGGAGASDNREGGDNVGGGGGSASGGGKDKPVAGGEEQDKARARDFLSRAAECREARYQSVGLGDSLRYEGRGVIGSALALDGAVIHLAFFGTEAGEPGRKAEDMAALGSRRRYRL